MKKRIFCSLIMLVSLGFTKIGAEEDFITEGGLQKQNVEVKAKVPVKYMVEIPRLLDLGSFNKTDSYMEADLIKEFNIKLRDAEIEYGESISVILDTSDLSMRVGPGVSFAFESSLTGAGLEFTHNEIYENNNNLEKNFNISINKEAIPAAGSFSTSVDFRINYTGALE